MAKIRKKKASPRKRKTSTTKKKTSPAKSAVSNGKMVEKSQLIKTMAKKAGITQAQAEKALQCFIDAKTVFATDGKIKEVKLVREKTVKLKHEPRPKKVELIKEKVVATKDIVEKIKKVEVIKEVPVEAVSYTHLTLPTNREV